MPGYHLIVWKDGGAAPAALFRAEVTDVQVLDALEKLGARPGNALGDGDLGRTQGGVLEGARPGHRGAAGRGPDPGPRPAGAADARPRSWTIPAAAASTCASAATGRTSRSGSRGASSASTPAPAARWGTPATRCATGRRGRPGSGSRRRAPAGGRRAGGDRVPVAVGPISSSPSLPFPTGRDRARSRRGGLRCSPCLIIPIIRTARRSAGDGGDDRHLRAVAQVHEEDTAPAMALVMAIPMATTLLRRARGPPRPPRTVSAGADEQGDEDLDVEPDGGDVVLGHGSFSASCAGSAVACWAPSR